MATCVYIVNIIYLNIYIYVYIYVYIICITYRIICFVFVLPWYLEWWSHWPIYLGWLPPFRIRDPRMIGMAGGCLCRAEYHFIFPGTWELIIILEANGDWMECIQCIPIWIQSRWPSCKLKWCFPQWANEKSRHLPWQHDGNHQPLWLHGAPCVANPPGGGGRMPSAVVGGLRGTAGNGLGSNRSWHQFFSSREASL